MKRLKKKKPELTYEIIKAASQGDRKAEKKIYDYYEPYIICLSQVPYVDKHRQIKYAVDEDIYMSLRMKLHQLIRQFKVA